jgi:hypothetical protein
MMAVGEKTPPEKLLSVPEKQYGEDYRDHYLEQYKLFVASSQQISDRRLTSGNYFLAINSSLVTTFGLTLSLLGRHKWNVVIPVAGLLVCLVWYSLVLSYKALNTAKFKVIHELEEHLPAALFKYEWHVCGHGKGGKYRPLTHSERYIPLLFGALYVVLAAYALFGPVDKISNPVTPPPVEVKKP